jgi:hypothetical protein
LRGTFLDRLASLKGDRQLFVFRLDELGGVLGEVGVFG